MRSLRSWFRRVLRFGVPLIVALHFSFPVVAHAGAMPSGAMSMRIEVSKDGFNGSAGDFVIEVEQGQLVELTFVWNDADEMNNIHRIALSGYGLQTETLKDDATESTIRFIATETGTFHFMCVVLCEGHENLQRAHLKVKRGSGGGVQLLPTSLGFTAEAADSGAFLLTARLTDESDGPLPDAPVRFAVDATIFDTAAEMELGAAVTDADGIATFRYVPTFVGTQHLSVVFSGLGVYDESKAEMAITVVAAVPAYDEAPTGLNPVRVWLPVAFLLIVAGIWSTFAYVLLQAFRMRREGGDDSPKTDA